jgi:hypothetical protein
MWTKETWPGDAWLSVFEDQINQILARPITLYVAAS